MTNKTVQNKLNESFVSFKENVAMEYGNRLMTYADLDKKSNYIANWLINKGIGKETFIGILMDNRMDIITTIIGILKAGCVFIPLDTTYPEDRLEVMIHSTDTKYIIADRDNFSKFETREIAGNQGIEFIFISDLLAADESNDSWFNGLPGVEYSPDDKIYIYYTSGTTGRPKAMIGKNKSLRHFIDWEIDTFSLNDSLRSSQFAPPGFDAFLRDVFVPLSSGGTLCIPENPVLTSPEELVSWVEKSRLSLIHCVPGLFRVLSSDGLENGSFEHLKYILLSGEKINPPDLENWYAIIGERVQLVNLWGTSETTLAKTCYFIRETDVNNERIPVGKPIKGARVIVLDKDMNICDDGVAGEIFIRTPFRTYGYYDEPELNKEKFIQNPFNDAPGDLIHKTGDLGKILPDGNLDVMGRVDRQVKIRGNRIELEEIENTVIKHPVVNEAVVIKKETSNKNEFLCAFVSVNQQVFLEEEFSPENIKEYLAKKLPEYMVPAKIAILEKIPRTTNGKVDYKILSDIAEEEETDYTPPGNDLEKKIAALWSEIVGVKKVGVKTPFFDLGGNSLNVMTLITKIHKEFDVRISLGEIFDNSTVEEQAKIIMKAKPDVYISIEKAEEKEYYALSSAQKRMYVLHQMDPENLSYNIWQFSELVGDIPIERFQGAFQKLIQRHESLRTSYVIVDEKPVQKIHNDIEFKLEYYDKTAKTESQIPSPTEFVRPFDLTRAPLMRVGLIKVEEEKHLFMFDMHHIITDAVSVKIFTREFMEFFDGKEPEPIERQYRDFSEWQNNRRREEALKLQEAYWLNIFEDGAPVLNIPTDFPRPAIRSSEGRRFTYHLEVETLDKLEALAKQENVTLYMLMLTVFTVLFSMITGQEEIVLGTDTAGRNHVDLKPMIGMFVNTVVLKNYPKKEKPFREFLADVRERTLEAFENQDYQFDDLIEKLDLKTESGRNPLFDVMLSFTDLEDSLPEAADETLAHSKLQINHFQYDDYVSKFDMNVEIYKDRREILVEYNTTLFKHSTIERFMNYFHEIVSNIIENVDILLKDISVSLDLVTAEARVTQTDLEF